MKQEDALRLRDRFFRAETTLDEERQLVKLLLADDCPDELRDDRHAILSLVREEALPEYCGRLPRPMPTRNRHTLVWRVAASLLAISLLASAVWAVVRFVVPSPSAAPATSQVVEPMVSQSTVQLAPRHFNDLRLDSILAVVSAHYGNTVCFRSDEARNMRFIITWQPDAPISKFIDVLNMADSLQLTLRNDTLFVDKTEEKEDAR